MSETEKTPHASGSGLQQATEKGGKDIRQFIPAAAYQYIPEVARKYIADAEAAEGAIAAESTDAEAKSEEMPKVDDPHSMTLNDENTSGPASQESTNSEVAAQPQQSGASADYQQYIPGAGGQPGAQSAQGGAPSSYQQHIPADVRKHIPEQK